MERHAATLAGSLVELGHRVVFYACRADPALAATLGVELKVLPVKRFPRKLQSFRFFRQVDRVRKLSEGSQITLTRVRVRDGVICGGTHLGYLKRARKLAGPYDWLQTWMETQAYAEARVVISHSDLCTDELVRWYKLPPAKIATLYPPVDDRFTPPLDEDQRTTYRRRLGLPLDKIVLLFPSMGHSRKGLQPVCEALKSLAEEVVLAVAGKSIGSAKWPFVQYLGYVEDMVQAYRAADFTILGSNYEPFGLVGPESILCGTRLIFEQNIGCLSAIKPEFVSTFSVWDPKSIRRAVADAVGLVRQGPHHIANPHAALRYDPSAAKHAEDLLRALTSAAGS
jgi:glycosyltransferase involved in cell wall biosynthesis